MKQFGPLISIIVPVYNVDAYLKQCVDSILNQKYENFELLLVDDGSTDKSGEICDVYGKRDKRVRVFHKKNGGVSSARNVGLDKAKGEWIAFVDSDDIVTQDYLFDLYNSLKGNDIDLVIQNVSVFKDGTEPYRNDISELSKEIHVYDKHEFKKMLVEQLLVLRCWPVSKLYRQSLIKKNNLKFSSELDFAEDYYFLFDYLLHIEKGVACASISNYFYREREGSLAHIGFGDFEKGYQSYKMFKEQGLRFVDMYNCSVDDLNLVYALHRTIMTAKSTSQLRSITSEDWDFFLKYFKVFTRKTKNDRWMVSHFKSHPFILLTYIKACRSLRNFLARTNMWGILDALKK